MVFHLISCHITYDYASASLYSSYCEKAKDELSSAEENEADYQLLYSRHSTSRLFPFIPVPRAEVTRCQMLK